MTNVCLYIIFRVQVFRLEIIQIEIFKISVFQELPGDWIASKKFNSPYYGLMVCIPPQFICWHATPKYDGIFGSK